MNNLKTICFVFLGIYVTVDGSKCQQSATSSCGAWAAPRITTTTTAAATAATAVSTTTAEWGENINTYWDSDQVQQQDAELNEHQAVQHSTASLLSGSFNKFLFIVCGRLGQFIF